MSSLGSSSMDSLNSMLTSTKNRFSEGSNLAKSHIRDNEGFVAFSGGKDSMASLHMALQFNPKIPVCFYDSGLEFPENIEYIHSIAKLYNINLHIIESKPTILDILKKEAFFDHKKTPVKLKTSLLDAKITFPSREAHERFGLGRIWGLRAEESHGRKQLLVPRKGTFTTKAGETVTSPVWNWSSKDIFTYLEENNIPVNPLYAKMRELGVDEKGLRVGSIVDGGSLDFGRITWLKRGWPEIYDKMRIALPRIEEFR